MSDTHDLKLWPEFFDAVASGIKPFEYRKCDRDFKVGDTLHLREYRPVSAKGWPAGYTGRSADVVVSYVFPEEYSLNAMGISSDYVILGFAPPSVILGA